MRSVFFNKKIDQMIYKFNCHLWRSIDGLVYSALDLDSVRAGFDPGRNIFVFARFSKIMKTKFFDKTDLGFVLFSQKIGGYGHFQKKVWAYHEVIVYL